MGISATGSRTPVSALRYGAATAAVVLALFGYLYGPPLMPALSAAAHRSCNEQTGSSYRTYRLSWQTTTFSHVSPPQWVCVDLRPDGGGATSLGWWVPLGG
jgi:hypothetical protein